MQSDCRASTMGEYEVVAGTGFAQPAMAVEKAAEELEDPKLTTELSCLKRTPEWGSRFIELFETYGPVLVARIVAAYREGSVELSARRGDLVAALHARGSFGKLLTRLEEERRSLVIEKGGSPRAVLLNIRDYVRLASPEPEVLRVVGEESKRKGTDSLTSRQIDRVIQASRTQRSKR